MPASTVALRVFAYIPALWFLFWPGTVPAGGTAQQFSDFIKVEIEKWANVIRSTRITVD